MQAREKFATDLFGQYGANGVMEVEQIKILRKHCAADLKKVKADGGHADHGTLKFVLKVIRLAEKNKHVLRDGVAEVTMEAFKELMNECDCDTDDFLESLEATGMMKEDESELLEPLTLEEFHAAMVQMEGKLMEHIGCKRIHTPFTDLINTSLNRLFFFCSFKLARLSFSCDQHLSFVDGINSSPSSSKTSNK